MLVRGEDWMSCGISRRGHNGSRRTRRGHGRAKPGHVSLLARMRPIKIGDGNGLRSVRDGNGFGDASDVVAALLLELCVDVRIKDV